MGRIKHIIISIATIISVIISMLSTSIFVYADTEYTYRIAVYGGNMGTINSDGISVTKGKGNHHSIQMNTINKGRDIQIEGLEYGDNVTIHYAEAVQVDNQKYYVKGMRRSFLNDDDEYVSSPSFTVEKDMDYVAVYGVIGKQVKYTVKYIEAATGKSIYQDGHFYGNVGDLIMIGHRNIEHYYPRESYLEETLTEREEENVLVFEYEKIE